MTPTPSRSLNYVGFDIGKSEHAMAVLDSHGQLVEHRMVPTARRELRLLVRRLAREYPLATFGCEATGIYHEQLALIFQEAGIGIRIVNPVLTTTKALRRNVRWLKTDASDAERIAQRLREIDGTIGHPFSWQHDERRLQALGRSIHFLMVARQSYRAHILTIVQRPLQRPVLPRKDLFEAELERLRKELVRQALRLYPEGMSLLMAIRGVAEYSAAALLAESGPLDRFATSAAFVAFAGLDPTIRQSGTSIRGKSSLSKSGSTVLRAHLGWMAHNLVVWNPVFRSLFENSVTKGKCCGVAYGIVARKFATVAHQCVKRDTVNFHCVWRDGEDAWK